jgi:hypothetical protein
MKVPSKMLYFLDERHWVLKPQNSRLWYRTVNDWVDQWCGSKIQIPASKTYANSNVQSWPNARAVVWDLVWD